MASADSSLFPVKGQAYRFRGVIRSTATGNPITGGLTTPVAQISKDDGNFTATAAPVEIQTSGYFYLDLTADEMNCNGAVIRVTAANANALELAVEIKPADLTELTDHWKDSTVDRIEQGWVQLMAYFLNEQSRNKQTGEQTLKKIDGTTMGTMSFVDDATNETKGKFGG